MSESTVFARASVKIQFRTSLPAEGDARLERQREFAAILEQLRKMVKQGMAQSQLPGWEVVVIEAAY